MDIDETDLDTVCFEEGESTEEFEQCLRTVIEEQYRDRNLVIPVDTRRNAGKYGFAVSVGFKKADCRS